MNYRSEALCASANGESCVSCGTQDETVVWAHSNKQSHGKGLGIKAHDLLGLYLCSVCHRSYDMTMTRDAAEEFFEALYAVTMVRVARKLASGKLRL